MLERNQPVDVLVVALLVERPVDRDAAKFQDIQAGESCGWQGRQDSLGGDAQGLVQWLRSLGGIERDCQNRTRGQLRRQIGFRFRLRQGAIETAAPTGAALVGVYPPRVRGE